MDSFYSNGISILTIFDEMYAMGSSRGREDSGYTYTYIYMCVCVCVCVCVCLQVFVLVCVPHLHTLLILHFFLYSWYTGSILPPPSEYLAFNKHLSAHF